MGGVCIALYGFIAVSGLKMVQKVDLNDNGNLFTVSSILIAGVGSLALTFGKITLTNIACALILGILTNLLVNIRRKKNAKAEAADADVPAAESAAAAPAEESAAQDPALPPAEESAERADVPAAETDGEKADGKGEE